MSAIAIITARGGSKRIPKKNIKDFCGKPIIAYSIESALRSKCFDEVMVSTDSVEIAEIASAYGAKVPFMRSVETSSDYATSADVVSEVLERYQAMGITFDFFCCLYPTAPFITSGQLCKAVHKLQSKGADALMTVVKYGYPPQRALKITDGQIKYVNPEYERTRSQDLEDIFHDCGQFYICNTQKFMTYRSMVMPNTIPFILQESQVQDIDTIMDWSLAELKYRNMGCQVQK